MALRLLGTWNALNNTPELHDSTGVDGTAYTISVAGSQNLGSESFAYGKDYTIVHINGRWIQEKVQYTLDLATLYSPGGGFPNPMTTLGDMIVGDVGGDPIRLPIGTNTNVLTVVAGIPTWDIAATGSVTNIQTSAPITGGPITTTGTIGIIQATTSTDGYLSAVDWNTFNNKQPSGTYVTSVTGTSNRITIGGTSTDPTFDISTSYAGQSTIVTLGTITTGIWNGTALVSAYIGSLTGGQVGISGLSATGTPSASTYLRGDNTWATFTSGTVTSVSGTTNRITSTGGTTPVIDISATFEALLGKVANPLSQFASTTSAQLAGVISDETGSGALVFGTSPTLVTPNLGTPSTLVGTNITGTATGLTAGNVTTNANLTGPITSVGNATSVAAQTGTGTTFVMNTSPTLVTPLLGTPTSGTLTNCTSLPIVAGTTGTLTETRGGTNQTTYTTGDILYASASNILSKLSIGTNGKILTVAGGIPTWATASGGGGSSYVFSKGLTNNSSKGWGITNDLMTGYPGGQTIIGGYSAAEALSFRSSLTDNSSGSTAFNWLRGNGTTSVMSLTDAGALTTAGAIVAGGAVTGTNWQGVGSINSNNGGAANANFFITGSTGNAIKSDSYFALSPTTATWFRTAYYGNSASFTSGQADGSNVLFGAAPINGGNGGAQFILSNVAANVAILPPALGNGGGGGQAWANSSTLFLKGTPTGTSAYNQSALCIAGNNSGYVGIKANDDSATFVLTLPSNLPQQGQFLTSDMSGMMKWVYPFLPTYLIKPKIDASYGAIGSYSPAIAGTATIDLALNNKSTVNFPAGNITVALSNATVGQVFMIGLKQDSTGSRTVTWFSGISWAGGGVPALTTTASKIDRFGFLCTAVGVYEGYIIGQNI